ncbi:MAG: hypothetical protein R3C56_17210 [Pirellulaceae bacterium]
MLRTDEKLPTVEQLQRRIDGGREFIGKNSDGGASGYNKTQNTDGGASGHIEKANTDGGASGHIDGVDVVGEYFKLRNSLWHGFL